MKKYLIVFGSLRKNSKRGYNFDRFGQGTQKHLKDLKLKGYDMYSFTSYPAICKGNGEINCELHEVEPAAASNIERMELGAGYTPEVVNVEYQGGTVAATIYTWPEERLEGRYPLVESGNWD